METNEENKMDLTRKKQRSITVCVSEKKQLISIITESPTKWIGHVLQNDSLLKDITEGRISVKRPSGRPHRKTIDWMIDEVDGKTDGHLVEKA